jgi:transmembrane sensor
VRWPFGSRKERLRREASSWVAKLRGPEREAQLGAFQLWYVASPDHALAYDRVEALYEASGILRQSEFARSRTLASRSRKIPVRYAFTAGAVACAAMLALFILIAPARFAPGSRRGIQNAAYTTAQRESRDIRLADGSDVHLSPGTALEVAFARDERRLRLVRGEALFSVAHEARRFVVVADGAEVVAHGTRFVVRLAGGLTMVSLVQGSIDVSYRSAGESLDRRHHARMKPGERLVIGVHPAPSRPLALSRGPGAARPTMLQFNDTLLSEAIAQANHGGGRQIRLGDPLLAKYRVTGAFRAGDTEGLAESLAAAFNLVVERVPDGTLVLRPPPGLPPSH